LALDLGRRSIYDGLDLIRQARKALWEVLLKNLRKALWLGLALWVWLQAAAVGQEVAEGQGLPAAQAGAEPQKGVLEGILEPDQYILGAGDMLEIGFWGDVNRVETVSVNPDGEILLAPVGPIPVAGLTLAKVRQLVAEKLAPYYRPDILSVSLVSIRSFQAHVVGMVTTPGAIQANAVTRASQAIAMADGLVPGASQRNIEIRRDDLVVRVDLSRYLYLGDNSSNPFLEDGDVVRVPSSRGDVQIFGSVFRPGAYEFVEGETLAELVALAGGLRPEASTQTVEVQRFEADDPTVSRQITIAGGPPAFKGFPVEMGDRIFIRATPDWHRDARVEVRGEIEYPGVYVIEEGRETLSQLISRAGGLTPDASLAEARLIRGVYMREALPIELELNAMQDRDVTYDDTEKELLQTLSREQKGLVSMSFERVFLEGDHASDPYLRDGDIVDIPRASGFVRVSGQVRRPGLIPLVEGAGYRYYIKQAGGYSPRADAEGARILRAASGQRVRPSGEQVFAGDIVWVPEQPGRDWWQITKDLLQIAAQAATVWLVVDSITTP
jgi:polysaccharide export outer membrane protein